MLNKMTINPQEICVSLLDDDKNNTSSWDDYVESNKETSIYHKAGIREVICKVFKHNTYYFYAHLENGKILGILPLVQIKSILFGNYMVSVPYFNYGGVVADNELVEKLLLDEAKKTALKIGVSHIEYRNIKESDAYTDLRTDKITMILKLPDNYETLWSNIGAKRRAQINRSRKEKINIEICKGTIDLLDDFYKVFSRNMRDLGTPVYAKKLFQSIISGFPDMCKIIVVKFDSKPVATAFLVANRETLEIPWASCISDVNHLGTNMLLYWETLKYAIENGFKYFDFGRSTVNSGTYRFKKQWGAEPKQLYWHYHLLGNNEMPYLSPANPKYKVAINLWQRIPVFVANILGPHIVKNLP